MCVACFSILFFRKCHLLCEYFLSLLLQYRRFAWCHCSRCLLAAFLPFMGRSLSYQKVYVSFLALTWHSGLRSCSRGWILVPYIFLCLPQSFPPLYGHFHPVWGIFQVYLFSGFFSPWFMVGTYPICPNMNMFLRFGKPSWNDSSYELFPVLRRSSWFYLST